MHEDRAGPRDEWREERLGHASREVALEHDADARVEERRRRSVEHRVGRAADLARALAIRGAEDVHERLFEVVLREERQPQLAREARRQRGLP